MSVGEAGEVAYLQAADSDQMSKLMAMGVLPSRVVLLEQRFPSFVFRSGRSEFAVDATIAAAIYVRLRPKQDQSKGRGSPMQRGSHGRRWGLWQNLRNLHRRG
jgi:ferrous iron transport protein A